MCCNRKSLIPSVATYHSIIGVKPTSPNNEAFQVRRSPMMVGNSAGMTTPIQNEGTGCISPPMEQNVVTPPDKGLQYDDLYPEDTNDVALFDTNYEY